MSKGFTLMEVLIAVFLFAIATIAIAGVSVLVSKTSLNVEKQVVAQAIANDEIETIQAMQYSQIGVVPAGATQQNNGALPPNSVEYVQTVTKNQQVYTITTDIIPFDDAENGSVSGTLTLENADYKNIRVQVTAQGGIAGNNAGSVVSSSTSIANWPPQTCIPGELAACTIAPYPTPPPTFSWNAKGEPVNFINGLGTYTYIPGAAGLYNDSATRLQACSLKGYQAEKLDFAGAWSSCGNNVGAKWNNTRNDFDITNGCLPTNSQSSRFTCSNPKPVAACTYKVACPASGRCSDASLARGYTPNGVQYSTTCKSAADCATGFTCNTSSGQCQASSPAQKYQYVTTGDPKTSGQIANCAALPPNPDVFGTDWQLRSRQELTFSSNNPYRDVCLWRRPTSSNYEYKLIQSNAASCPATYAADTSFTLKSSGCVRSGTAACPSDEYTSGKSSKADYCLYEKQNGITPMDLVLMNQYVSSPTSSNQANCTLINIPEGSFSGPDRACVSGGTNCGSDICLWKNVCPLPSNVCTIVEYDASKATLPEAQGWTKNDTTSSSTSVVSHFLQSDTPKYITLTDHSGTGYVDYTYSGIDPSVLMDQNWTYEITMRTREGNKDPLAVGPIALIVSDGLKYISTLFEQSLIGPLSATASPYAYITSKTTTTTDGFHTYTITSDKLGPGVSDDSYNISVEGVLALSDLRRSDGYAPGTGDFAQGLLFGMWATSGQGSVDVSRVLFKTANCDTNPQGGPTVTIESKTAYTSDVSPGPVAIPLTITFSDLVTGFAITDISVQSGTKSNFSGSGTTYQVDVTPSIAANSYTSSTVIVSVPANAATGQAAGVGNVASQQFSALIFTNRNPIREVVNDAGYGPYDDIYAVEYTQASAREVCNQAGYSSVHAKGKKSFDNCSDNKFLKWASNTWNVTSACSPNVMLDRLQCVNTASY